LQASCGADHACGLSWLSNLTGRKGHEVATSWRVRDPAPIAEHLASVAPIVICVSTNVSLPAPNVSPNVSRKPPFIAVPGDHHCKPLQLWGLGDTSSSDGQFFRAGGRGEARADHNARYGSEPGVLFYTHVSDRYAPFHSKVIAPNTGEASHVIDGLLDHESGIAIREHATDTAGAVDHVFGLCHLLGFRFAPRIRDLG
jgi:hypothetical protein